MLLEEERTQAALEADLPPLLQAMVGGDAAAAAGADSSSASAAAGGAAANAPADAPAEGIKCREAEIAGFEVALF